MIVSESDDFRFESLTFKDCDELSTVVAKSFTTYEPLAVSQQKSLSEFKALIKTLSEEFIKLQLSYIAKDKKSDKIVGAILTDDFASSLSTKKMDNPVSAILSDVSKQYRKSNEIKKGKYLHVHFLSVDQFYHGRHIINTLIGICLDKAVNKGYEYAVAEATGLISQHILKNQFDFDELDNIQYKTYVYNGEKPFVSIKNHPGVKFMVKKLI